MIVTDLSFTASCAAHMSMTRQTAAFIDRLRDARKDLDAARWLGGGRSVRRRWYGYGGAAIELVQRRVAELQPKVDEAKALAARSEALLAAVDEYFLGVLKPDASGTSPAAVAAVIHDACALDGNLDVLCVKSSAAGGESIYEERWGVDKALHVGGVAVTWLLSAAGDALRHRFGKTLAMDTEGKDVGRTTLRGERIVLRHPIEAVGPALVEAIRRSLPELSPWMPWAVPDYDVDTATKWIRGEFGDAYRFVMTDPDGEIVGACGINRVDEMNRSANMGYWVRSDRAGQGYATEATRLLARFGLDPVDGPELRRLQVVMSTRNHASRRVAEKAGAAYEGTLRDCLLLRGEFHDAHLWSFVVGDI